MVDGKHMPDCGLTGNETNENKHEKPNGVSNFFNEFSVIGDLQPVTCVLYLPPSQLSVFA